MATAVVLTSPPACDPLLSFLRSPSPPCSIAPISYSCALEASTSSQHSKNSSFDWSDFPIISRDSFSSSSTSSPVFSALSVENAAHSPTTHAEAERTSSDSEPSPSSSAIGVPSASSADCPTVAASPSCSPAHKRHKKRAAVAFSPFVEVRTFTITLGDHPCCAGGMALSCDWVVQHTAVVDLDVHERYSLKRRQGSLRLSYVQRRHRLVECTGLSPSELLQLEYQQDAPPSSDLHPSPSPPLSSGCFRPRPLHATPSVQRNLIFF